VPHASVKLNLRDGRTDGVWHLLVDRGFLPFPLKFLRSIALRPPIRWTPLTDTTEKRMNDQREMIFWLRIRQSERSVLRTLTYLTRNMCNALRSKCGLCWCDKMCDIPEFFRCFFCDTWLRDFMHFTLHACLYRLCTLCLKKRPPPFYFDNNSAKNQQITIIFGTQHHYMLQCSWITICLLIF